MTFRKGSTRAYSPTAKLRGSKSLRCWSFASWPAASSRGVRKDVRAPALCLRRFDVTPRVPSPPRPPARRVISRPAPSLRVRAGMRAGHEGRGEVGRRCSGSCRGWARGVFPRSCSFTTPSSIWNQSLHYTLSGACWSFHVNFSPSLPTSNAYLKLIGTSLKQNQPFSFLFLKGIFFVTSTKPYPPRLFTYCCECAIPC